MKTDSKNNYEGMFLVDAEEADFQAVQDKIIGLLERSEAELVSVKLWDERKLAYSISGKKRGLYVLTYFKAAPERIVDIEHDCRLDDKVIRILILRRDTLAEDLINAETPATKTTRKRGESGGRKDEKAPPKSPPVKEEKTPSESPPPRKAKEKAESSAKDAAAEQSAEEQNDQSAHVASKQADAGAKGDAESPQKQDTSAATE